MAYQLIVHADDFGLTKGTTDAILKGCDAGSLLSVSILSNGLAFDYAIQEIKKRPNVTLAVHLNFLDGFPVAEAGAVDQLVDKEGKFNCSFLGLWAKYNRSSPADKKILEQQIRAEVKAQINKVAKAMGGAYPIHIDSHNHFHLLPFIFPILIEHARELNIVYIRVPQEKFFWHWPGWGWVGKYLGDNVIKHYLLNHLSRGWKGKLKQLSIRYPEYFIGVLFTGTMSEAVVRQAVGALNHDVEGKGTVEILFHPGRAKVEELRDWPSSDSYKEYYCSAERERELNELLKPSFRDFIERSSR